MFVIYVGIDKYVTTWLKKKMLEIEVGCITSRLLTQVIPTITFNTVMFIYTKSSLNVHFSQLIMMLHFMPGFLVKIAAAGSTV